MIRLLLNRLSLGSPLLIGSLAMMLSLAGWVPQAQAQTPTPSPSNSEISTEEVRRYARAGLMIENARRQLEQKIGREQMQGLSCNSVEIKNDVAAAIAESCASFENVVAANQLDEARFNLIYTLHQTDANLAGRILTEMSRICLDTNDSIAASFCQDTIRVQMLQRCNKNTGLAPAEICTRLRQ